MTKKISPKKRTRTPELKLLFEKIKLKKQMATAEKEKLKETPLDERKTMFEQNELTRGASGGGIGDIQKIKRSTPPPKPQGNGDNVRDIIKKFEIFNENSRSPSTKFQKGGSVNWLKKLDSPLKLKNTVSQVKKKKNADALIRKFSKLSSSNIDTEVENGRDLMDRRKKRNVNNPQRTIMDIWGPELSKAGPKSDF